MIDLLECKHNYQLLDVEKTKRKFDNSIEFKRATRLFCTKCAKITEKNDVVSCLYNEDNRPEWTYNV